MITKLLILISQATHVLVTLGKGSEDEMLSSAAWRQRSDPSWERWRYIIDHWTPLGFWRDLDKTHCESCYEAEQRKRKLTQR